jgi:hypothetical protein
MASLSSPRFAAPLLEMAARRFEFFLGKREKNLLTRSSAARLLVWLAGRSVGSEILLRRHEEESGVWPSFLPVSLTQWSQVPMKRRPGPGYISVKSGSATAQLGSSQFKGPLKQPVVGSL